MPTSRPLTITIDLQADPDLQLRVDVFQVPESAREEFHGAMRRSLAFLETLPGFRGHLVLEKTGGPTAFNVATIAVWESPAAVAAAGEAVRAYYREIGFDPQLFMARLGVSGEMGNFQAQRSAW
ncbi:MAG TPA: antibiotic biosynthesis monooxygenase [Dehalococcoidia bacterium]|nr:antibiotic biosynthesis monooxygenase [Dehalococcoidia bacterium]